QEFGIVHRKDRGADLRIGVDHSVGERVIGCPPVHLVPAAAKLVSESESHLEVRAQAYGVFDVPRSQPRTPTQRSRRGIKKKTRRSLQEGLEPRESRLAELAQSDIFVRLQPLKPHSSAELMASFGERNAIFIGE